MSELLEIIKNNIKNIKGEEEEDKKEIKEIISQTILTYNMEKISEKLKDKKKISEYIKKEFETKEKKEKKNDKYFQCYHKLMSSLAFFFNFVSVYEIVGILNSIYDIIRQEILYYIYHSPSTKKMTFREAIINNSFRTVPELEVEMISSIIGELLLKSLGLEISYVIFFFVNIICLIVLLLFPF